MTEIEELQAQIDELEKKNPRYNLTESDIDKTAYITQIFNEDGKQTELSGWVEGFSFSSGKGGTTAESKPLDMAEIFTNPNTDICVVMEVETFNDSFESRVNDYDKELDRLTAEIEGLRGNRMELESLQAFRERSNKGWKYAHYSTRAYFTADGEPFTISGGIIQIRPEDRPKIGRGKESEAFNAMAGKVLSFFDTNNLESRRNGFVELLKRTRSETLNSPTHIVVETPEYRNYTNNYFTIQTELARFLHALQAKAESELVMPPAKQGNILIPKSFVFENNLSVITPFQIKETGTIKAEAKVGTTKKRAIMNRLEIQIKEQLTPFDRAVWEEYENLRRNNPEEPVTFLQIAKSLHNPTPHKNGEKPRQIRRASKLVKEVEKSMRNLWENATVKLNIAPEKRFYNELPKPNEAAIAKLESLNALESDIIEFRYVEGVFRTVKLKNGTEMGGIHPSMSAADRLIDQYLEITKRRTSIARELLTNPLQPTKRNILIFRYLANKIGAMPYNDHSFFLLQEKQKVLEEHSEKKARNNRQSLTAMPSYSKLKDKEQALSKNDRTINVDTLIKEQGLENSNRTRICTDIETILEDWKANRLIYDFTPNKGKGGKTISFTISIF